MDEITITKEEYKQAVITEYKFNLVVNTLKSKIDGSLYMGRDEVVSLFESIGEPLVLSE